MANLVIVDVVSFYGAQTLSRRAVVSSDGVQEPREYADAHATPPRRHGSYHSPLVGLDAVNLRAVQAW